MLMYIHTYVEIIGQFVGVSSLILPPEALGIVNSGYQAWWQMLIFTELSHQLRSLQLTGLLLQSIVVHVCNLSTKAGGSHNQD